MRLVIVGLLALAAAVRAGIDWRATTGHGEPYRLASIGEAVGDTWPETYGGIVAWWQASPIPFVWDPFAESLLSLPLALVVALIATLFWVGRSRPQPR